MKPSILSRLFFAAQLGLGAAALDGESPQAITDYRMTSWLGGDGIPSERCARSSRATTAISGWRWNAASCDSMVSAFNYAALWGPTSVLQTRVVKFSMQLEF